MLKGYLGWIIETIRGPSVEEDALDQALLDAVIHNNTKKALKLIKRYQDSTTLIYPNVDTICEEGNFRGWTALHIATYHKNHTLVTALIEAGADRDITIKEGDAMEKTAGQIASELKDKTLIQILIPSNDN